MKDVGSTSFGLAIAYLLPGFAGMFAISFWAPSVADLFSKFLESESNVGRFLLMLLCSLVVGLEVSVCRWLLFEKLLCRKYRRDVSKYRHLSNESKLNAFRAAVDENYRYHQFWGGMAIVTPIIAVGLVRQTAGLQAHRLAFIFILLEALNIVGAYSAYRNYIDSTHIILEGSPDAERLGTDRRGTRHEKGASAETAAPAAATTPSAKATAAAATEKKVNGRQSCEITGAETPP